MGGSKESQGPQIVPPATDRKFRQEDEHILAEQKQEVAETKKRDEEMIPVTHDNPELARRKAERGKK
jgi:hypothetical protein